MWKGVGKVSMTFSSSMRFSGKVFCDNGASVRLFCSAGNELSRMYQGFCDEYGVESRTAKELVARNEKVDATLLEHEALPYPPYLDRVFPGCIQGHRVFSRGRIINEFDHLGVCKKLFQFRYVNGLFRLHGDGLGVGTKDGDADAGGTDGKVG